jgi:hypothetical protein
MATVEYVKASRQYPGNPRRSVDQLDLDITDGEFLVLVGPSRGVASPPPADARWSRGSQRRRDPHRWRGRLEEAPEGPRHRDGLPELCAVPAHDRRRQHGIRAAASPRHHDPLRSTITLRHVLSAGEFEWIDHADTVLHFTRGGRHTITNFGPSTVDLPPGTVGLSSADLVDGRLPAAATAWLVAPGSNPRT